MTDQPNSSLHYGLAKYSTLIHPGKKEVPPEYSSLYPTAPSAAAMVSPSTAIGIPLYSGVPKSKAPNHECEDLSEELGQVWLHGTPATFSPPGNGGGIFVTPEYNSGFVKNIMESWGLILDGKYRENILDAGAFSYVSKYSASEGESAGLYCYNFALKTSPYDFQPSGAMNLSKFSRVEFEIGVIQPPLDPSAQVTTICDASDNVIGVNKPVWQIYKYSYNLVVMEERYNVLSITSGMAALEWAR